MAIEIGRINVGNGGYGNNQLYVTYDLLGQSTEHNNSTVRCYLWLYCPVYVNTSWTNVSIHTTSHGAGPRFSAGNHHVATVDIVIGHNTEGVGEFAIGYGISSSFLLSGSGTTRIERLPTIPRATYAPPVYATLGKEVTVPLNRASSNFAHNIFYDYKGKRTELGTQYTNVTFTVSEDFYEDMINEKSATGTFYVDTYSGSTFIGRKTSVITVSVDEETSKPTLSVTGVDIDSLTTSLTGDDNVVVLGESNVQLSMTYEPKHFAEITDIIIDNSSKGVITEYIVEDAIKEQFTVQVVDSRGLTNTQILLMDKVDYIQPTANLKTERNTPVDNKIKIDLSGNYYNAEFGIADNTLAIKWRYRETSTTETPNPWSEYIPLTYTLSENTYKVNYTSEAVIDYRLIYDIEVHIEDELNQVVSTAKILKGIPIYWWNEDTFNFMCDVYDKNGYKIDLFSQNSYTSEEVIVGKWIDEKPIYRKTFDGSISSVKNALTQSNLGYDTITKLSGNIMSNYHQRWPIGQYYPQDLGNYYISWYYTNESIYLVLGSYYSEENNCKLIVEYTKK